MRTAKLLRGAGIASAALITLCLAWVPAAASARPSSPRAPRVAPGGQLWVSRLPGGVPNAEAVSPDGTAVFVTGYARPHIETVAYDAATGARLWATAYLGARFSDSRAIAVSPDGSMVYVTGDIDGARNLGVVTIAYSAGSGKQLWARRYMPKGGTFVGALTLSPDGRTLYVAGNRCCSSSRAGFVVIAYAAATGRQRWLRHYTGAKPAVAESAAVSPDGKTVYVTGRSSHTVLTVAYRAAGTVKWATRYKSPYRGSAYGGQVVAGPDGRAVYVVGEVPNKWGHDDIATFAYRAATGRRLWLDSHYARTGGGPFRIAVTPGDQTVIIAWPRSGGLGGYEIAAYNARTGSTRWARRPAGSAHPSWPAGLFIDPRGNTVFVASSGGSDDAAAYSVARGTVLWTSSYAGAASYVTVASALSSDGTRLFLTGVARGVMTTVAYQT